MVAYFTIKINHCKEEGILGFKRNTSNSKFGSVCVVRGKNLFFLFVVN